MSEIARLRSPEKTLEADRRIGQSQTFLAGQVHRTVQSVASKKKRQGSLLVQSDSSGRTTSRTHRHTDKLLRLSQSKAFGASLRTISKDELSYRPITSFGRIILRTDFRLDQSHPSVGSSFGQTSVSTNHILRSDHPSDGLLYRPITPFGRTVIRTDFSYLPITSLGRTIFRTNFRIGQSHPSDGPSFRRTFRIGQSDRSDGYLTVILQSQSLESSSRSDGQTLKLKPVTSKSRTSNAQAGSSA